MKSRMTKKLITAALVLAMSASMIACGESDAPAESTEESVSVEESASVEESVSVEETVESEEEESVAESVEESTEESTPAVEAGELVIADNAVDFATNLKLGWNLGNTLDATDGKGMATEVSWGQPYTTKELIDYVKAAGFSSIRIPTSWHNHMTEGVIDEEWMNRVKEIVDWSLDAGLYVILNSHHDNDAYYPSEEHMNKSKTFIKAVWTQVSEAFKDYDNRLMFESMNEPRLAGTAQEWWFADSDTEGNKCIKVVNELNQVFVDTVRASGGNNAERFLMVPCAIAAPQNAINSNFKMPTDTIENHLVLSVHAYTPYDFTMNDNGYDKWSSSKTFEFNFMGNLKTKFINNGYGVCIGEFGATNKDNLESRCQWAKDYCLRAASLGISCFLWDNGGTKVGNENFGMIDRKNLSIYYPELLDAMLEQFRI